MKATYKIHLKSCWNKAYKSAMRKPDFHLKNIQQDLLDDYDSLFNRNLKNGILLLQKANRNPLPDVIAEVIEQSHNQCTLLFKESVNGRFNQEAIKVSVTSCMIDYMSIDIKDFIVVFAVIMTERLSQYEIDHIVTNIGGEYLCESECIEIHIWKLYENDLFNLQNCLDTAQDILFQRLITTLNVFA